MRISRRALLKDLRPGHDLGKELEAHVAHLCCEGDGISPYEPQGRQHPQKLYGPWINNFSAGEAPNVSGMARALMEHVKTAPRHQSLQGSLVVYTVAPDPGEGFSEGPLDLAAALIEALGMPKSQPCAVFAHMRPDLTTHMHLLLSRYDPLRDKLLQEGDGWGLKTARRIIAGKATLVDEDFVLARVRTCPGIEAGLEDLASLAGILKGCGVLVAEGPTEEGMTCSFWGASKRISFNEAG